MRSYASIDRIEGEYAVLELELLDTNTSKITSFKEKETVMLDFYKDAIIFFNLIAFFLYQISYQ